MDAIQSLLTYKGVELRVAGTKEATEATELSLHAIQPLSLLESDNKDVRKILNLKKSKVSKLFSAIHQSYRNAVLGCAFAKDAKTLCKGLYTSKRRDKVVIQDSIKELYTAEVERERAKTQEDDAFRKHVSALQTEVAKAKEESKCTVGKYLDNLKAINSVIENIQTTTSKIQSKQEHAKANKAKAELRAEGFHRRRRIRVFSPISAIKERAFKAKARIHNEQYAQCTEALKTLEYVKIVIGDVMNKIVIIESYWDDTVETLQLIHDQVRDLRHDASLKGRLHGFIFDFEQLEESYRAYKEELEKILRHNHSI